MRVLLVAEEREKRERKLTVFSRELDRVREYTTMHYTTPRFYHSTYRSGCDST
jgi:hypothetical protein